MKLLVSASTRLLQHGDRFYAHRESLGSAFWERYLTVFDGVTLMASSQPVDVSPDPTHRVDSPNICVLPLPPSRRRAVQYATLAAIRWLRTHQGAFLVRSPAFEGDVAGIVSAAMIPMAVEVVGDPHQVAHSLRKAQPLKANAIFLAGAATRLLIRRAASVAYVSRTALEHRYPALRAMNVGEHSSVELSEEWFSPRVAPSNDDGALRIVTVASLDQPYKGVGDLLEALSIVRSSVDVRCVVVGGGRLLSKYQQDAAALGLSKIVTFTGELPSTEVKHYLDQADIFVLASWTEGLPRALIEAMARGLPCIASDVGGNRDLLPAIRLVPPRNPRALARELVDLAMNPSARHRLALLAREGAEPYSASIIQRRRTAFYEVHRRIVEDHYRG